jgi:uncharacterized protein (TIGR03435 family)
MPARWILFAAALPALAQQFKFEVASIKPSNPPAERRNSSSTNTGGNGLRATNVTAFQMIRMALHAQDYQLSGGPGWLRDSRWDINAKNDAAEEAELPREDRVSEHARYLRLRGRILNMLEDRFHLVLREETKELPAYILSVDKGGPRLKAVSAPKGSVNSNSGAGGGFLRAEGISIENLCENLSGILERPVVDETGLNGFYDLELKYSLDNSATGKEDGTDGVTGPSIFTAVRESLGLRLTGRKATVKSWVIVSAEKPDDN